jgi:hypothetical protein
MSKALGIALQEAFEQRERHRAAIRAAREEHKKALACEERVRQLRALERDRARRGRAA